VAPACSGDHAKAVERPIGGALEEGADGDDLLEADDQRVGDQLAGCDRRDAGWVGRDELGLSALVLASP
jgi:hypothetical protein